MKSYALDTYSVHSSMESHSHRLQIDQMLKSDGELMGYIGRLPAADSSTIGARASSSDIVAFEAGDVIAARSELTDNMYILLSGKVNLVVANAKNQRMVAGSLGPGAIFGEGALREPASTNVFVEGAESGKVVRVPAGHAHSLVERHPILGWALLQTYGQRQLQIEQYMEDVAYKTLPQRVANILLELSDMENGEIAGLSHQNLADRLGTYRETISAILRTFKQDGMVELGYRRINIVDAEGLMDLAGIWEW